MVITPIIATLAVGAYITATADGAQPSAYIGRRRILPQATGHLQLVVRHLHDAADMPTNPTKRNRYRTPPVNGCVPDEAAEITRQRAAAESSSMMRLASRHCAEWCCWRQQTRCS